MRAAMLAGRLPVVILPVLTVRTAYPGAAAAEVSCLIAERLLRLPAPARLPVCSNILTDPDDNVWVVLSFPGDSVTTLRVFGRDDRVLGDVSIPAALEIHEIGSDYLLASGESADGEPWVRVYRVRRTAAP